MRIYTPKYTKWWGLFILMLWGSYAALANRNLINSVVTVSSDLTSHVTSTPPSGTVITWHSGSPATDANKVADPTAVGPGTYFAAYYDATNSCYSPASAPVQIAGGSIQASNVCPATTVNLTTHSTGTPPSGTTVTWHTGTPATAANKVADPTMVGSGTYYAAYFDATNSCYSPTSTPVQVTINSCSSIQVSNVCPATTVNLTTHSTGTPPSGTTVTWHTGTPATSANKVADPTMVGSGTYYAAYFDATNSCYSPTSTPVQVTINSCSSIQVSNVCPATTVNLTTHSTGTPPSGTTVTWHTGTPATAANKVADPTMAGAGTYYAAYFDATNNCYSPTSTPVQVTITTCTTPTNPPLVVIPPMVTEPGKPVTVCGTINDPDIGDTHTVTICGAPTKGTLATPTVNNTTHKVCLTYTPSAGQTGSDQVCLIVCDQTGKCDTVTVPIVITPTVPPSVTPQPPVVVVTGIITPQDSTTTTCMPIVDPNGTGTNTYTICGAPKNGTANPITTAGGLLCVTYKPNAGYVGKDSLCLIVCDAGNLCDTILIPITVYPKVIPGTPQPPVVILPPIVTEPGNPVTICGLVNDPNVGDTHTATLCNTPSKGTISGMTINNLTHQLCLTYTPQSGQTGNDEVCVTVCDQTGKCTTVEVPVTIVPANGKPIATDDIAVTPKDKPVSGNVLTNDNDPEGGPLTVSTTPVTPPTKGTVTLNPDGTFTYTPNPGQTGTDGFCYKVCDAQSSCDTACVTVNILPDPILGNDKPIANDDNTQTTKNTPVIIAVKANDIDPDGNATLGTPSAVSSPSHGTVVYNANGTVTYTPTAGFVGKDSFSYKICDTGTPSLCDTANVDVEVLPTPPAGNQAPVAVDDAILTSKNTPVSGTVAANDSDPDNNTPLTFAKVTNPVNGTVTVNADGTYTYTPTTGFVGSDKFTYKVCDSGTPSKCDTATVSIVILPAVNQAPIATGDIAVTPQDKPVTGNVLTNDKDPEGGPLTVSTTPVTPPTKGTVTLNPDGTFVYTPTPGKTGEDVFCYQVSDAQGLKDTACVTVEIVPNPVPGNDAPIAADDNTQTPKDQPVVIAVKANDTDPDGNVLGSPTKISNPTNGTATVNPDGTITYTPNTGFVGTDTFRYSICDNGVPSKCDTATVTVNVVLPVAGNQAPVAVDDAKLTTVNTPVSGTVAANDSDPDNNTPLTFTKVTNPLHGTVTVNSDGTYTYTPTAGYIGNDSYTYKVCDSGTPSKCDTATVSIGILPAVNQAPIATGDIAVTPQDKPVTGNVLTNDKDPEGGPLTVSTTPVTPPTKGTVTLNPDGTFVYTPTPGKTGEDVFCYQVTDAQGLKDTACVTVEIVPNPVPGNDAPIAADDNTQTPKDQPVVIAVKANDTDPDGNVLGTPTKVTNPTNGTATVNADGTITYTPTAGFTGTDSFKYSVCDNGVPSKCDTATVTVNVVLPVAGNQAPVAVDDANLTTVDTPVSGTVAANDSDPDNNTPLTFTKVTNPLHGTVTVNSDGTYTYTPTAGYIGNDSYTYKVCDSGTPSKCDTATVSIGIMPAANQAPIATGDIAVTPQDKPVTGNVLTNDKDPEGGPLTVSTTPVTPPTKGTVTLNPDGTFVYTPTPGKTGEDVFCYQVSDAQGLKDTACVTVEIVPNPVPGNDAPIAADDNTQTPKDQPVVIAVKANDTDPDGNVLGTPTKVTNPTHGTATVNADGTITYTPNTGFTGTDTFKYSVCDNGVPSKCDTATVTVNVVLPVAGNQAPVAVDDAKLTTVNTPVSGTVAANDSDPDNNTPLTFTKVTNPLHGTVTVNSDGTYTYTPTAGYIGNDSYTYKVCDSGTPSKCDTATVSIGILPAANQAPIATGDIAVTPQDKPVTGNVLTNDKDPEGGPLTVSTTPVTPPTKGTVTLNPDGTFVYTPTPGKTGEDVFCYQVSDAQGLKDTACVTVEIVPNPVPGNDAPIAADDNTQTPKDQPVVIAVKANDTDPDGNVLGSPTKISNPTNGTATVNPDGTITYTPNTGFVGTDTFRYSICDNGVPSKCDTATVTVNVVLPVAGNQVPVAVDDANLTTVNTPVSGTVAANDSDPDNNTPLTFAKVTNPVNGTVTVNSDGTYTYTPNTGFIGNDKFTYKVCDSGVPSKCDTATVSIGILPATKVCLQAKVYLQGALFGVFLPDSLMRDDLRVNGYLPTTSPYPAMGMSGITNTNTSTLAVVGPSSPTGRDAIVDWVFVELRSATNPATVIDSRSALLQRDGDIVDVDGVSSLMFNSAVPASYYVAVKHRNHLGVMSKSPIDLSQNCPVVDFRKPSTLTYNLDATSAVNIPQVDVVQGVAMWAGNALNTNVGDGKHEVIYQGTDNDVNVIYQQVINAPANVFVLPSYKLKGYYSGDINLNGEVIFQGTGNDVEFIYQNVIKNHTGNTLKLPFFKIKEQLP